MMLAQLHLIPPDSFLLPLNPAISRQTNILRPHCHITSLPIISVDDLRRRNDLALIHINQAASTYYDIIVSLVMIFARFLEFWGRRKCMCCFCEDSARQPLIHNNMLQIAAFKRFREIFRVNLRMAFRILVFIGPIRRRVLLLLLGILRDGMV